MEDKCKEKKIVHIISRDKFTAGYINFMKYDMDMYEHYFILRRGEELQLVDNNNIHFTRLDTDILFNKDIKKILQKSDKIIISGFYYYSWIFGMLPKEIMLKTYIHFWGGDFYRFRKKNCRLFIESKIVQYGIQRCKAIIMLIEDDYKQLSGILNVEKKYLVAPMPRSVYNEIDYSIYWSNRKEEKVRILVGNSAALENCHLEVLEMLKHLKDENIEILCPLSYGNERNKKKVIQIGKQVFGDKFVAVTNYMSREEYVKFLSKCTVGVFNNDRQQAMGNISILVQLGKKVYLKKNTSMWYFFEREGMQLWDISKLKSISIEELSERDEGRLKKNAMVKKKMSLGHLNAWTTVFED